MTFWWTGSGVWEKEAKGSFPSYGLWSWVAYRVSDWEGHFHGRSWFFCLHSYVWDTSLTAEVSCGQIATYVGKSVERSGDVNLEVLSLHIEFQPGTGWDHLQGEWGWGSRGLNPRVLWDTEVGKSRIRQRRPRWRACVSEVKWRRYPVKGKARGCVKHHGQATLNESWEPSIRSGKMLLFVAWMRANSASIP